MKYKIIHMLVMCWCFLSSSPVLAGEGHNRASSPILDMRWGLDGLKEAMNLHPIFVHFPIALLLGATAFYWAGALFRKNEFVVAGKWTLVLGAISAAVAVWTGLRAANSVTHNEIVHAIMMRHQYLGYAILSISVILAIWSHVTKQNLPEKGRWFFLGALGLLSLFVIQTGDLGGRMVFLKGVGVGKKSMLEKKANVQVEHDHSAHQH
jgi:uncharacterized membrane protein